jgi:hypothetical protein
MGIWVDSHGGKTYPQCGICQLIIQGPESTKGRETLSFLVFNIRSPVRLALGLQELLQQTFTWALQFQPQTNSYSVVAWVLRPSDLD